MFFRGEFDFLSNFYNAPIQYGSILFPSVENYFQAMKTQDITLRRKIAAMSAIDAKKFGKTIPLRPDWEEIKLKVMEYGIREKFRQNPVLVKRLLAIDGPIVEENTWNDTYWGVYNGSGRNHLGKILEMIRSEHKPDTTYFGQDCTYFAGIWEDSENRSTNIKQPWTPVICFCNHPSNINKTEGNCTQKLCPLNKTKGE